MGFFVCSPVLQLADNLRVIFYGLIGTIMTLYKANKDGKDEKVRVYLLQTINRHNLLNVGRTGRNRFSLIIRSYCNEKAISSSF